jgi:CubicO group peptidase (beta-lactamase class C family)
LSPAANLAGGGVLDGERCCRSTRCDTRRHAATHGVIPNGFGHFGFGGFGAWANPDNDLAVAFVCNRVAGTPFGDT